MRRCSSAAARPTKSSRWCRSTAPRVLFDQSLARPSSATWSATGLPVNDRTALILEIFAQRAQSHEGKLQVELARLQYLATRLVRRWSPPGTAERRHRPARRPGRDADRARPPHDRRAHQAHQGAPGQGQAPARHAAPRARAPRCLRISLVGYTNAGKSTLFNALVKARAYAADQLFATLDTTTRQLYLEEAGRSVSLSDTVGFIRDLPHRLVAPSRPRWRRRPMPICCCTWSTPSSPTPEQMPRCERCWRRSAPTAFRRCWCSTS